MFAMVPIHRNESIQDRLYGRHLGARCGQPMPQFIAVRLMERLRRSGRVEISVEAWRIKPPVKHGRLRCAVARHLNAEFHSFILAPNMTSLRFKHATSGGSFLPTGPGAW